MSIDVFSWFREHAAASVVVALVALLGMAWGILQFGPGWIVPGSVGEPTVQKAPSSLRGEALARGSARGGTGESGAGETLRVRSADLAVESENPEEEFDTVRTVIRDHGGYVQTHRKSDRPGSLTHHATLRVPADRFDASLEALTEEFAINDLNVSDYRINVQAELDEIDVLNQTLEDLERLRNQIQNLADEGKTLELLMQLNEKKLQLVRQLKRYERQLARSRYQSEWATLQLTMTHRKPVDLRLWPEDAVRRWKQQLQSFNEKLVSVVIETPITFLTVVLRTLQGIVYLAGVLLPIGLVGRGLVALYRRIRPGGGDPAGTEPPAGS